MEEEKWVLVLGINELVYVYTFVWFIFNTTMKMSCKSEWVYIYENIVELVDRNNVILFCSICYFNLKIYYVW